MENTHSPKNSKNLLQIRTAIKTALTMMAAYRGAKPDANQITLYCNRLEREISGERELMDVVGAIEKIADMERKEGEPTFPAVAQIISLVPVMATARHHRQSLAQERGLVVWICNSCGYRMSGFLAKGDNTQRSCQSLNRCAADLDVFTDERPRERVGGQA